MFIESKFKNKTLFKPLIGLANPRLDKATHSWLNNTFKQKFYLNLKKIKERKSEKKSLCLLKRRSLDSPPRLRLWLPFLFFFFNLLQWRFERVWSYPMNTHTLLDQIHNPFKGKNKQQPKHNCMGNRSIARNNRSSRGGEGHHGPWQPPRPGGSVLPGTIRFASLP